MNPVGTVGVRPPNRLTGGTQVASAVFSGLVLAVWIAYLISSTDRVSTAVAGMIATAVYLVAAYFLSPEPDYSNVGLFGFIDHPLRFTDDMNRMLVMFKAILWPGRLIATGIVEAFRIGRGTA